MASIESKLNDSSMSEPNVKTKRFEPLWVDKR